MPKSGQFSMAPSMATAAQIISGMGAVNCGNGRRRVAHVQRLIGGRGQRRGLAAGEGTLGSPALTGLHANHTWSKRILSLETCFSASSFLPHFRRSSSASAVGTPARLRTLVYTFAGRRALRAAALHRGAFTCLGR